VPKYNDDIVNEYVKFVDLLLKTDSIESLLLLNTKSPNGMIRQHCLTHYNLIKDPLLIHSVIKSNFIRLNKKL
jgi:hypothetical protein